MPVVGFLRDATAAGSEFIVNGLRKGLAEAGFVEGQNLVRGQGRDLHDLRRIRDQQRSRGIRAGREPQPPGRQSHRWELLDLRAWSKATGADARDGAKGYRLRRPRAPDLSDLRAVHQRY